LLKITLLTEQQLHLFELTLS